VVAEREDLTNATADKHFSDAMSSHLPRLFAFAVIIIAPPTAGAQDSVAVNVGARARVYVSPVGTKQVGVVERVAADTLFLRACRGCHVQILPRGAIQHVDISLGRGGYALRGVGYGVLIGTAFGVFVIGRCRDRPGDQLWQCGALEPVAGGLAGAALGMLVGGALGRWWPFERWRPARMIWPVSPTTIQGE
jgi:hypothetical protein